MERRLLAEVKTSEVWGPQMGETYELAAMTSTLRDLRVRKRPSLGERIAAVRGQEWSTVFAPITGQSPGGVTAYSSAQALLFNGTNSVSAYASFDGELFRTTSPTVPAGLRVTFQKGRIAIAARILESSRIEGRSANGGPGFATDGGEGLSIKRLHHGRSFSRMNSNASSRPIWAFPSTTFA